MAPTFVIVPLSTRFEIDRALVDSSCRSQQGEHLVSFRRPFALAIHSSNSAPNVYIDTHIERYTQHTRARRDFDYSLALLVSGLAARRLLYTYRQIDSIDNMIDSVVPLQPTDAETPFPCSWAINPR